MAALTADRAYTRRDGKRFSYISKAAEIHFAGAGVALDVNGEAVAPTATTGLVSVGIAVAKVDNTADGEVVEVEAGVFGLENSGANVVDDTDIGALCYWEDDQTVGTLATGMSIAGVIVDFDSEDNIVWVEIRPGIGLL
jgi:hypothetical protein